MARPYKSFYERVLEVVMNLQPCSATSWAHDGFSYDILTLINVAAWEGIGQWDPAVPYYFADCDAYARKVLSGYDRPAADTKAGRIFDVVGTINSSLGDLERFPYPPDLALRPNADQYRSIKAVLGSMKKAKKNDAAGRNTWWAQQDGGGQGQSWSPIAKGLQYGWWKAAELGKEVSTHKWGQSECNVDQYGGRLEDMRRSEQ